MRRGMRFKGFIMANYFSLLRFVSLGLCRNEVDLVSFRSTIKFVGGDSVPSLSGQRSHLHMG